MKEPFVAPQPQSLYAPSHTADPKEPATRLYSWPLAKGVTAEVRFIGRVQPKHLDLLCKYLEVAKTAIELDSEGDEEALQ